MFGASNLIPAGAAALAGAILGIQLGHSTVAAIKPTFFLGPAVHPRDRGAAIDPREIEARRLARLQSAYHSLYGWDEGHRSLRLACLDCAGSRSRPHPDVFGYDARVPYFGSRAERAADEAREQLAADRQYRARLDVPAELSTDPAGDAVSRYSDYPLTEVDVSPAKPEVQSYESSDTGQPTA